MIVVLAMMLIACTSPQHRAVLDSADSLMNARPDSALTLLNALLPDTTRMSKGDLMRFHLLRTNAENKCDTVLTARHAALMRRVCDYYDHKASPFWGDERGASRMLAHYLLGRCYSDMGEAPAALREYTHATEIADTTDKHCDFILLSNIYYQDARLLLYQMILPDALRCYHQAEHFAYRGRDTLRAISCYEHSSEVYYMMDEPDSILAVCKQSISLYRHHGFQKESYNPIPLLIKVLTDKGEIKTVGDYLEEYEEKSGLFNSNGDIEPGREMYYYMKGEYLLSCRRYSEAEQQFRKLFSHNDDNNNVEAASKGLFHLYQQLQIADSIAKYAQLYCNANDSSFSHIYTGEMVRAKAMYDYGRLESVANAKSLEAARNKNLVFLLGLVLSLLTAIFTVIYAYIWKVNKQKRLVYTRMNLQYITLLNQHNETNERLERLQAEANDRLSEMSDRIQQQEIDIQEYQRQEKTNDEKLKAMVDKYRVSQKHLSDAQNRSQKEIEAKKKEIETLNLRLLEFQDEDCHDDEKLNEEAPLHFVIVRRLHQMAANGEAPKEKDWEDLVHVVSKNLHSFYSYITDKEKDLSELEIKMGILIRLDFIVSECCILLDKTSQSVTNIRTKINRKLFNCKGTKSLKNNIKSL
jgi:tetratricopeptide (TPR) repeat protein